MVFSGVVNSARIFCLLRLYILIIKAEMEPPLQK